MTYRISTVAEMTGIPRNTLIAWERRYGLVCPPRQENGYRHYTEADISKLLRIKNALNAGFKISEAISLLESGASVPSQSTPSDGSGVVAAAVPLGSLDPRHDTARKQLFDALISYRSDEASRILRGLLSLPFSERLHQVLFPVLRMIGSGWEKGELSVAQEHFATGLIKAHLATVFIATSEQSLHAPLVVTTTMPHDDHEIGALALSIEFSLRGFRVSYLGAKMPLPALLDLCQKQLPATLAISSINPVNQTELLSYVQALQPLVARKVRVMLGGWWLGGMTLPNQSGVEIYSDWSTLSDFS